DEGQNIFIGWRFAEGDNERFAELFNELARLPVELLFIADRSGVAVAKQVTTTIPIVMTDVTDVVEAGRVSSLGHPGGNVTGLAVPSLVAKQLELLHGTLGGSPSGNADVAVLWRPTGVSSITMPKALGSRRTVECDRGLSGDP